MLVSVLGRHRTPPGRELAICQRSRRKSECTPAIVVDGTSGRDRLAECRASSPGLPCHRRCARAALHHQRFDRPKRLHGLGAGWTPSASPSASTECSRVFMLRTSGELLTDSRTPVVTVTAIIREVMWSVYAYQRHTTEAGFTMLGRLPKSETRLLMSSSASQSRRGRAR